MRHRPSNVHHLNPVLSAAERGGYAVRLVLAALTRHDRAGAGRGAGRRLAAIVQISQKELARHQIEPGHSLTILCAARKQKSLSSSCTSTTRATSR